MTLQYTGPQITAYTSVIKKFDFMLRIPVYPV